MMGGDAAVNAHVGGENSRRHDVDWGVVKTGMTGGRYGVGHRVELDHTRERVDGSLDGTVADVPRTRDPVFGLSIPDRVPGVPDAVLTPRQTWDDPQAYDRQARELARDFADNFEAYADQVSDEVRAAGPSVEVVHS